MLTPLTLCSTLGSVCLLTCPPIWSTVTMVTRDSPIASSTMRSSRSQHVTPLTTAAVMNPHLPVRAPRAWSSTCLVSSPVLYPMAVSLLVISATRSSVSAPLWIVLAWIITCVRMLAPLPTVSAPGHCSHQTPARPCCCQTCLHRRVIVIHAPRIQNLTPAPQTLTVAQPRLNSVQIVTLIRAVQHQLAPWWLWVHCPLLCPGLAHDALLSLHHPFHPMTPSLFPDPNRMLPETTPGFPHHARFPPWIGMTSAQTPPTAAAVHPPTTRASVVAGLPWYSTWVGSALGTIHRWRTTKQQSRISSPSWPPAPPIVKTSSQPASTWLHPSPPVHHWRSTLKMAARRSLTTAKLLISDQWTIYLCVWWCLMIKRLMGYYASRTISCWCKICLHWWHWKVVIMTTSAAASDYKVGIMFSLYIPLFWT